MLRRFHSGARAVRVATPSPARELGEQGIGNTRIWSPGVDFPQFGPDRRRRPTLSNLPRPVLLSGGRVGVDTNLDAFLSAWSGRESCWDRVCQYEDRSGVLEHLK